MKKSKMGFHQLYAELYSLMKEANEYLNGSTRLLDWEVEFEKKSAKLLNELVDKETVPDEILNKFLFADIHALTLSTRTTNCLYAAGLRDVDQIIQYGKEHKFLKLQNCGRRTLVEITKLLELFGVEHYE